MRCMDSSSLCLIFTRVTFDLSYFYKTFLYNYNQYNISLKFIYRTHISRIVPHELPIVDISVHVMTILEHLRIVGYFLHRRLSFRNLLVPEFPDLPCW